MFCRRPVCVPVNFKKLSFAGQDIIRNIFTNQMLYDVVWGLGKPSSTILSVFFNIVQRGGGQTHIKNCNIHVQNEGGLSQQC